MKSLLVFIPKSFHTEKPGYIYGRVVYDHESNTKKFYVIGTQPSDPRGTPKIQSDLIGYFSGADVSPKMDKKVHDWIQLQYKPGDRSSDNYFLNSVIVDNHRIDMSIHHTVIIIYDKVGLLQAELFINGNQSGNHFLELKEILERKVIEDKVKKKGLFQGIQESVLMYTVFCFMYPVMFLSKLTNKLLPISKYSTLGLHLSGWLENVKWLLATIIQEKRISLKTSNHILATAIDVSLGVLALKLLLHYIGGIPPSQILLDNAEVRKN
uniref:Uncharacterized protein n=1 Tax=Bracon brevicornis TaxID=1563983 RepID=A0A6V7KR92_9HYME